MLILPFLDVVSKKSPCFQIVYKNLDDVPRQPGYQSLLFPPVTSSQITTPHVVSKEIFSNVTNGLDFSIVLFLHRKFT